MIGLDTNVLVRFLVQDDPSQSRKSAALIEDARAHGEDCFINGIVLCETVWVLEAVYEHPKTVIVDVLEKILLTKHFKVENSESVWSALADFKKGKADFSDYFIGRLNTAQGARITHTFDKALKGSAMFTIV